VAEIAGFAPFILTIFLANGGEEDSVQGHLVGRVDGSNLNREFLRAMKPICATGI